MVPRMSLMGRAAARATSAACWIASSPTGCPTSAASAPSTSSGVGATETVFIGDSAIDIETGRNAGVQTVAVEHGFGERALLAAAGPDDIVRDLARVLELAGQQGW